jgi:hypothetical protein
LNHLFYGERSREQALSFIEGQGGSLLLDLSCPTGLKKDQLREAVGVLSQRSISDKTQWCLVGDLSFTNPEHTDLFLKSCEDARNIGLAFYSQDLLSVSDTLKSRCFIQWSGRLPTYDNLEFQKKAEGLLSCYRERDRLSLSISIRELKHTEAKPFLDYLVKMLSMEDLSDPRLRGLFKKIRDLRESPSVSPLSILDLML